MRNAFLLAVWFCFAPASCAVEAGADLAEAESVYRTEGPAAALPAFERLLAEFVTEGNPGEAAVAQRFIGECHWRLGNFEDARAHLQAALAHKEEPRDREHVAKTLNVLGLLEWDLGNLEAAIARFEEASSIGKALGNRKLEGATLNNLSLIYDELGDYERSIQGYRDVLHIYSGIEFPRGEGDTLGNIGGVHLLLGQYTDAVKYYRRALEISERLGSVPAMSQDHGNLGLAFLGMGRTDEAIEHFDRALMLAEQAGMRQERGFWLRGRGNARISAGRYDDGLKDHRAALAIYRADGTDTLLLDALHDMGQLLLGLGDPESAEAHFSEAMELARSVGVSRAVTVNQLASGDIHYRHQRLETAAELYAEALKRSRESGELQLEARALIKLARVHADQGQYGKSAAEADRAREIGGKIGARGLETEARLRLAETERAAGRYVHALELYDSAARLADRVADPDLQWRIEYGRAMCQSATGELRVAIGSLQRAAGHIESVRSRLREDRYRAGYLQDKQHVYVELVRLQLQAGEAGAAFSTAERMRSWAFLRQAGPADRRDWTDAQRDSESSMRGRIRQLQRMLEEEEDLPKEAQRRKAFDMYARELMLAESEYQAFLDDLQAAASRERPDATTEKLARRALRQNEALLEYVVGPEQLVIFVLRSGSIRARTEALKRVDLRARVELLRDLLNKREHGRWKKPASKLAQFLVEPLLEEGWLDGVDHLYLVPHGMLNYLPFTLLPGGSEQDADPLIKRFSISYLPTASILKAGHDRDTHSLAMLAMAPARSQLRFAPQEARSLVDLFRPNARALTGKAATEAAFRDKAHEFRFLHLATHGYFNNLNPLLSGLELEPDSRHDGLLEVHEILQLELNSDLITLSACQTGMGSGYFAQVPAGDDFVGMTRAFLQAGSASVMATLWEVDDRSTVDLMQAFYSRVEKSGPDANKAVALAEAQRALLVSEEYSHPYYWAPFVLVGPMRDG